MSDKSKEKSMPVFLSALGILLVGRVLYYLSLPVNKAKASFAWKHKDDAIVDLGRGVHSENCASCHGVALGRHANCWQRDANGYLPAPPEDEIGHTWHHSDSYLFLMTK